ncbi:Eukaryotic translation initiation factor 3 subunit I [Echinococcus granulosus]|uniref:Eukaryotic translation initiation factor 3 subunit I n=1 Tax=Echinococcus granulosus TaxID=6210 RepID=A0A068X268_ECHGR|nr:Eukaryotic translation initiation factor 3 subunit I [Echinococcus granulosus]CDS24828.1 eukaryotic translation initiation factor 3 [Echinococcus granulosus]
MRPICLRGHERAITRIIYNKEGDLIFTAGKNPSPNVWFSRNGERLGTFNGHAGVVWCLDVDWTSTHLISGSGDATVRLWDVSNGKELNRISRPSSVRACGFSYSGHLFFFVADVFKQNPAEVCVLDTRDRSHMTGDNCVLSLTGSCLKSSIKAAIWGDLEDFIITGSDNGDLNMIDMRQKESVKSVKAHSGLITDLQVHVDGTMFISASKDHTAKLHGIYELDCIRTYTAERPVNSASISPNRPHVLLGGGQEARDVTVTAAQTGKFDARFYHMVYAEEFGRVKGHFGPINSVAFNPDGSGFATGGEDGYVRLHVFDPDYEDVEQRLFSIPTSAIQAA